MPELPPYMLRNGRPQDQEFAPSEKLYRRVRPESLDGDEISLDAIAFPDMSVTRQKYGPPESSRWEYYAYKDWGVIAFAVKDIPAEIPFRATFVYRMRPSHEPTKINYPHAEVKVFEAPWTDRNNERHVGDQSPLVVDLEAQLIWCELILRACEIALKPCDVSSQEVIQRYIEISPTNRGSD